MGKIILYSFSFAAFVICEIGLMLIVIVKNGKQKSEVGVRKEIVEKGKNRGNKRTPLETTSVYPYLAFTFQLMFLYGLFHLFFLVC